MWAKTWLHPLTGFESELEWGAGFYLANLFMAALKFGVNISRICNSCRDSSTVPLSVPVFSFASDWRLNVASFCKTRLQFGHFWGERRRKKNPICIYCMCMKSFIPATAAQADAPFHFRCEEKVNNCTVWFQYHMLNLSRSKLWILWCWKKKLIK